MPLLPSENSVRALDDVNAGLVRLIAYDIPQLLEASERRLPANSPHQETLDNFTAFLQRQQQILANWHEQHWLETYLEARAQFEHSALPEPLHEAVVAFQTQILAFEKHCRSPWRPPALKEDFKELKAAAYEVAVKTRLAINTRHHKAHENIHGGLFLAAMGTELVAGILAFQNMFRTMAEEAVHGALLADWGPMIQGTLFESDMMSELMYYMVHKSDYNDMEVGARLMMPLALAFVVIGLAFTLHGLHQNHRFHALERTQGDDTEPMPPEALRPPLPGGGESFAQRIEREKFQVYDGQRYDV